jgi:hypothetical protein
MNVDGFWRLLDDSAKHSGDRDARLEWLQAHLVQRGAEEIIDFEVLLLQTKRRADTWLMWGAAYLICDGLCSDDGFWYFQSWLVGLGRQTFERVVADPDSLVDVPEVRRLAGRRTRQWDDSEWPEWESLNYVASLAYERVTGSRDGIYDALEERGHIGQSSPSPPGVSWDFEDQSETATRFPRLSRAFPLTDRAERDRRVRAAFDRLLAERGQTEQQFFAELGVRLPPP